MALLDKYLAACKLSPSTQKRCSFLLKQRHFVYPCTHRTIRLSYEDVICSTRIPPTKGLLSYKHFLLPTANTFFSYTNQVLPVNIRFSVLIYKKHVLLQPIAILLQKTSFSLHKLLFFKQIAHFPTNEKVSLYFLHKFPTCSFSTLVRFVR